MYSHSENIKVETLLTVTFLFSSNDAFDSFSIGFEQFKIEGVLQNEGPGSMRPWWVSFVFCEF